MGLKSKLPASKRLESARLAVIGNTEWMKGIGR